MPDFKYNFLFLCTFFTALVSYGQESMFRLSVNKAEGITNNPEIRVHLRHTHGEHIKEMKVSLDPDFVGAEWEKFHHEKDLTLPSDGDHTVFAMVKTRDDEESAVEAAFISLDREAPGGTVVIEQGKGYSNSSVGNVALSLEAEGADYVQIRSDENFHNHGDWTNFEEEMRFTLTKGEGEKWVYVRFKDEAGNISEVAKASVIVDYTKPTGRMVINDDEDFTISRVVYLSIWADEDVQEVRIVGPKAQIVPYEPGREGAPMLQQWLLDSLEGRKVVKVYFRDRAGNMSTQPVSDFIILDESAPANPRVGINNNAKYTTDPQGYVKVRVAVREKDIRGYTMMISNEPDFNNAERIPFASISDWQIEHETDGRKPVFVKIYDAAGNFSEASVDSIMLDRQPPQVKSFQINEGALKTNKKQVMLSFEVDDAHKMEVSNDANFSGAVSWEPYLETMENWPLMRPGENTIYVKFKDEAGNVSDVAQATIIFDGVPPKAELTVNDGNRFIQSTTVMLALEYDPEAVEMQISNNPDFSDLEWIPVSEEVEWDVEEGDGIKMMGIRFRDEAGNVSPVIKGKVILDSQPPVIEKMSINNEAEYANKNRVGIYLEANDDAYAMMISEDPSFKGGEWQPYKDFDEVYVAKGEGVKTVYVKLRDAAGNESEVVSDDIYLDEKGPVVNDVVINNGEPFSPQRSVPLSFDVDGATMVKIGTSETFRNEEWRPYQTRMTYTIPGESGDKNIIVVFKDDAGNLSLRKQQRITLSTNE